MLIIGIFEQSIELEQALAVLENSSISRDHILVVFMEEDMTRSKSKDITSKACEVGFSIATGFAVIGASMGFMLAWGPIFWGIIGAFSGFSIGFCLYYFLKKHKAHSPKTNKALEVTIIVQCTKDQSNPVKDILLEYKALSVGQVEEPT